MPLKDAFSALCRSASAWSEWRNDHWDESPDLAAADLTDLDLSERDLSRTRLQHAQFCRTNLSGTRFDRACLQEARFLATDLSRASGLDSLEHSFRINVDIQTLCASKGALPRSFVDLLGLPADCPPTFVDWLCLPPQYASAFISYASEDQPFAEYLHYRLRAAGARTWFAPASLRIGEPFGSEILDAVSAHGHFVVVLSPAALRSTWVGAEVNAALQLHREAGYILPVRIVSWGTVPAAILPRWAADIQSQLQIEDFTGWQSGDRFERQFTKLLRALTDPK